MKRYLLAAATLAACSTFANAALTHRYSFTTDASDSVGGANGTLVNGASITGGQVNLANGGNPGFPSNGTGTTQPQYVSLPADLLPNSGSASIDVFQTISGSGFYTETFYFANTTNSVQAPAGSRVSPAQFLMGVNSRPGLDTRPGRVVHRLELRRRPSGRGSGRLSRQRLDRARDGGRGRDRQDAVLLH